MKAASCVWCTSEMPSSKKVNGHSFTFMPHCLVFTAVAEWRGDVTPFLGVIIDAKLNWKEHIYI